MQSAVPLEAQGAVLAGRYRVEQLLGRGDMIFIPPGANKQLRVHGAANVWIAGSSVFPTSGCANPTYTIVALSIRLARHLRGVLRARESVA